MKGVVIISSPCLISKALSAKSKAIVPLPTAIEFFTSIKSENSVSNLLTAFPCESIPDFSTSSMALNSSSVVIGLAIGICFIDIDFHPLS